MAWKSFCKYALSNYYMRTYYYANLNEKDLTDNKQFWRTVKPLLSDKIKSSEKH